MSDRLPNIHPGEVLLEEFLKPLDLSQNRVAREIGVPPRRINEIVLAKRAVTPDTALRLARYFGTSERFWLGLQTDYDLEEARLTLQGRIEREVQPLARASARHLLQQRDVFAHLGSTLSCPVPSIGNTNVISRKPIE